MLTDILKHLKDFYNDEMGYEYGDEYWINDDNIDNFTNPKLLEIWDVLGRNIAWYIDNIYETLYDSQQWICDLIWNSWKVFPIVWYAYKIEDFILEHYTLTKK
jgi:hypothetical protein